MSIQNIFMKKLVKIFMKIRAPIKWNARKDIKYIKQIILNYI